MVRSSVRVSVLFAAMALCASFAIAQKVFIRPHVLTDSAGTFQGVMWNPIGGQPEVRGSGTTPLAGSIRTSFSLYGNDSIYRWLIANVNVGPTPTTFDIYSLAKDEPLVWTGADMIPQSITLPGCDVDAHDPDGLRVVGRITFKAKEGATLARAQDDLQRKKMWLPSNFRLRIGDLPCNRIMRVDPITLERTVGDLDGDDTLDVYFNPKEFAIVVPAADGPAFDKAFEATVASHPTGYRVQLDYLDTDGMTLLSLALTCKVIAAGPTDYWMSPNDPSATRTYKLESIQDESKGFSSLIR